MVTLRSGVRYWTVLDEGLAVVPAADSFLRQVRFGRDGAESTTKAYAGGIALFLRWCARSGRTWEAGAGQLGLFMTWLAHAGREVSGAEAPAGAAVLAGPGKNIRFPTGASPPTDIQAALTVVTTRNTANDGSTTVIDLQGAELTGAQLTHAELNGADLTAREVAAFVVSQSPRQTAFAAGKASLQVGRAGWPGGTPC